jgi:ABC-type cobalamin/Fe3+-siderophores transport system ATPase subunit
MRLFLLSAVLTASTASAFVPGWAFQRPALVFSSSTESTLTSTTTTTTTTTQLWAKKKSGANNKLAALEALEALEGTGAAAFDQGLSNKELMELEKKQKKEQKAAEDAKAAKLSKAMAMDKLDQAASPSESEDDTPKLSKKELKELKKKQEKEEAKAAAKAEKKGARAAEMAESEGLEAPAPEVNGLGDLDGALVDGGDAAVAVAAPPARTLEDKIRKERPPPRIRVMESSQPGYTSLRLENIGITFRNQEVLKDVTWGVTTGDRIGLVGANGAGKTTQLRILYGEMEPTTGDVVKSSKDLRVAMLRQEFIDELVKERTLKEEFMSVFVLENKLLQDLKDAETALGNMSETDTEAMQEILDKMQGLQQKAEDKEVYALESKVKKVMDLMGFTEEEGEDLVASFSGGWKMRIGLGKVLLQDPNILLLGKSISLLC